MAEETKPAPSRHRLEKLTEDYIGERRKRRGESVRRILGMPVAPETTVSEMAEFNKAMAMHMKEITAFQNKVFDTEQDSLQGPESGRRRSRRASSRQLRVGRREAPRCHVQDRKAATGHQV